MRAQASRQVSGDVIIASMHSAMITAFNTPQFMLSPNTSMCFVVQEMQEEVSASGIVIHTGGKRKAGTGVIYAINTTVTCPHCIQQYDRKDLKVGDKVLFSKYVSEQVELDGDLKGKIVYSIPVDSILAKLEND